MQSDRVKDTAEKPHYAAFGIRCYSIRRMDVRKVIQCKVKDANRMPSWRLDFVA